jgi:hypothetical protein
MALKFSPYFLQKPREPRRTQQLLFIGGGEQSLKFALWQLCALGCLGNGGWWFWNHMGYEDIWHTLKDMSLRES